MTYVVTYVDAQPDFTRQAITLLLHYRAITGAEVGNSGIAVLQENARRNRFVLVEAWQDESFFQLHENAEHTAQFRSGLRAIHNSPYDQRVHHVFSVGPEPKAAGPATLSAVTHVDVPPP